MQRYRTLAPTAQLPCGIFALMLAQLLLLQVARTRVAGQMRDADALQGKLDAMSTEVA